MSRSTLGLARKEITMICPYCNGKGKRKVVVLFDPRFPEETREQVCHCDVCNGTGKLPHELEKDFEWLKEAHTDAKKSVEESNADTAGI